MSDTFKALVLTQGDDKQTISKIEQLTDGDLPEGDVLLAVDFSSLNYKDGLAITGKGKIVRQWPLVPGIDLAGVIQEDETVYQYDLKGRPTVEIPEDNPAVCAAYEIFEKIID